MLSLRSAKQLGFAAGILVLGMLFASQDKRVRGDEVAKKPGANAWTFDEAMEQLSFHRKDPYLQYVALQLGAREGRRDEVVALIERRERPGIFGGGEGRRNQVDLFSTFTGALAVQESLQLDTMRGQRPGRNRPTGPAAPKSATPPKDNPPVPAPAPLPPGAKHPETLPVEKLEGPTVQSHPWAKMLGGKKPDVGVLAPCVPEDFWFAEFKSPGKLNEVTGLSELWGGHIFTQALGDAKSQVTVERIKKQLGLFKIPPEALEALGIEGIAVTGSDLFLGEGSDVTILVHSKTVPALITLVEGRQAGAKREQGKHADISYTHLSNADGSLNAYTATPRADLHIRSNSLAAFRRVLECVTGKDADGKPARRLGESPEFRYIRTLMPRGAAEEDGLVYLSDPFIRRLVGAQVKLTERRRILVYNHLRMIGHACLMFRTERGRSPKSLEELFEAACAPGIFGKGDLAHPDGGTYSLSADGMSGVCSKWGKAESLTPCTEHLVAKVSGEEAEEYRAFVKDYNEYWRTYFDPIAVRVQVSPKQYRLETLILPLIDNSIYTTMASVLGGPAVALDALPTPKREIGGVWVHMNKQLAIDALGPEIPGEGKKKDPAQPADPKRDTAFARTRTSNDLKQIGLAIHNYHDAMGFLPADIVDKAGKPILSWRVQLLPYLEQENLYKQFKLDEPWDSENNKKLLEQMPPMLKGPSGKLNKEGKTSMLAVVGKDTVFPQDGSKLKLQDITDGTSNTIAVVVASDESAVEWTKPVDLAVDLKQPLKGIQRPDRSSFQALFADGSVRTVEYSASPVALSGAYTRAGGEELTLPNDEAAVQRAGGILWPLDWGPVWEGLDETGFDKKKLLRFLKEGIGDQVGFHMHDASKLFDYDVAGAIGGTEVFGSRISGPEALGIGVLIQFLTGPSSISIPVKDTKAVDEFLEELDRLSVQARAGKDTSWLREYLDFYKVPFPKPHVIRCHVVKFLGLKCRLYWGRIGDGLYIANRPFILDDLAAAHAAGKKGAGEKGHALLRLRPENWKEVLPGYLLGWAENHRAACHDNLSLLANVHRGWNDRPTSGGTPDAALMERMARMYGVRPFCPDGGRYTLAPDGKGCSCSVHGNDRDPKQPPAPTDASATGKLLKTLAGLRATLTFEEDGLRAVVTFDRKE